MPRTEKRPHKKQEQPIDEIVEILAAAVARLSALQIIPRSAAHPFHQPRAATKPEKPPDTGGS